MMSTLTSAHARGGGRGDDVRAEAEAGNVEAQFKLACALAGAEGDAQVAAEALQWFHRAAEGGSMGAQAHLMIAYSAGDGVPQDMAQAMRWCEAAAEQGHPLAQQMLQRSGLRLPGMPPPRR
mmetsp:Transcript_23067/g.62614  ORF Transcript_23067/g.62614 Transcript_23067/m.62614 type:complete len:122 (+) Transcript_23067:70-435(+)